MIIFIAFLPMLIFRDFTPDNEARYLLIADEALRNGHFFSFTLHGEPYADKPPFYFWLVMLFRVLTGHHSMLALSMLSFLPAAAIIRVMNGWAKRSMTNRNLDTAMLMLFTTAYFAGAAIVVRMDMLMCLFIVLALCSFWRLYTARHAIRSEQWLMGLWLFMALFTKGPLGLLIPLVVSIAFIIWKRRLTDLGRMWNWRTWVVLAIGCVVWFGMTYHESGGDYLYNLVFHQTVDRGIDSFRHAHPFYYYMISIWYEWLPWSLLIVGGMIMVMIRRTPIDEVQQFFLCAVLSTLVLLSCVSSKLQIYLLPAFPFAIYLAAYLFTIFKDEKWVSVTIGIPQSLLVLAFPGLFAARHFVDSPVLSMPLVMVAAALLTCFSAAALYWLTVRKSPDRSIRIMAYGVLTTVFVAGWAIPMINPYLAQ